MADLEILRDDPGGTVTFHGNLEDNETYLYWYKINDLITHKPSGTWIHESKYTKAHWRIPNLPIRTKDSNNTY